MLAPSSIPARSACNRAATEHRRIIISPTLTLNGGGTVTLSDNGGNRIYGASGDVLNNVNNTIEGAGQFGARPTLRSSMAAQSRQVGSNALNINLGSTGMNMASGELLGVGTRRNVDLTNGTYTNPGLIRPTTAAT